VHEVEIRDRNRADLSAFFEEGRFCPVRDETAASTHFAWSQFWPRTKLVEIFMARVRGFPVQNRSCLPPPKNRAPGQSMGGGGIHLTMALSDAAVSST